MFGKIGFYCSRSQPRFPAVIAKLENFGEVGGDFGNDRDPPQLLHKHTSHTKC